MFDFAPAELLVLGAVAIIVIPPKDLPKAMRVAGHWIGKMRGVAGQFRSGFDSMVREAELQDLEKKWAAENERIMREHPQPKAEMTAIAPPAEDVAAETVAPPVIAAPPEVGTVEPELPAPTSDKPKPRKPRKTETSKADS